MKRFAVARIKNETCVSVIEVVMSVNFGRASYGGAVVKHLRFLSRVHKLLSSSLKLKFVNHVPSRLLHNLEKLGHAPHVR